MIDNNYKFKMITTNMNIDDDPNYLKIKALN